MHYLFNVDAAELYCDQAHGVRWLYELVAVAVCSVLLVPVDNAFNGS